MVREGEQAPDFSVPEAPGEDTTAVEQFTLSEALGDGPIVLAFYPAAFTGGCADEMRTFERSIDWFHANDVGVYGISVDLPSAQNKWIQEEGFSFPMLSDANRDLIHAYDVVREDTFGNLETARRSIFVLDADGIVRYRWVQGDELPDFDEVIEDVKEALDALQAN